MVKPEIVLVIGASGCLGQHIVKLLQERDDNIEEIRVYDKLPFENELDYCEQKKVTIYKADIRNKHMLLEAMEDVDCVIHCAAIVDLRVVPDEKAMEQINVEGTVAVIDACLKRNVPRLIFASTTEVCCGTEYIFYGAESTTPIPSKFMLGKYAETKAKAEAVILKANGRLCVDGETTLKTVSLRPTPFYGECDWNFVPRFLRYTKKTRGVYLRVKRLDEHLQISYVGNVAWAFIKAKNKLTEEETIAGETFFITDDTPVRDIHEHLTPFIEAQAFNMSSFVLPYWFAWIILSLISFCIQCISYIHPKQYDVPSVNLLNYMCSTFFFNRAKATLRLDYEPIYKVDDAICRSIIYYSALILP